MVILVFWVFSFIKRNKQGLYKNLSARNKKDLLEGTEPNKLEQLD